MAFALGFTLYGVVKVSKNGSVDKKQCTDTQCTVQIIDGICFAKVAGLDAPFSRVECDKNRKGTYNTTLPCNVDKNGSCQINCNEIDYGKIFLISLLSFLNIVIGCGFLALGFDLIELIIKYMRLSKNYEVFSADDEENSTDDSSDSNMEKNDKKNKSKNKSKDKSKDEHINVDVDSECVELEETPKTH